MHLDSFKCYHCVSEVIRAVYLHENDCERPELLVYQGWDRVCPLSPIFWPVN